MVSSENGEAVSESDFETNEKSDCLNGVVSTIDVVSHEQIVCLGWLAADTEKFLEVMELAVAVTATGHRGSHH